MALRLRRLCSTAYGSSRLSSGILQYRSVQTFTSNCVPPSSVNHSARHGNFTKLDFFKGIMTSPCLRSRVGSPYVKDCGGSLASGIAEYGLRLNSLAHELTGKRLFSSKRKTKSHFREKSHEVSDSAVLGGKKVGDGSSPGKTSHRSKKHKKLPKSCSTVDGQSKIAVSSPNSTSMVASKSGKSLSRKQHQDVKEKKAKDIMKANNLVRKDQKAGDNAVLGDKKIGDGNSRTSLRSKKHKKLPNSCSTVNGESIIAVSSPNPTSMIASKSGEVLRSLRDKSGRFMSKKQLQDVKEEKAKDNMKANNLSPKDQKAGDNVVLGDKKIGEINSKTSHRPKKHKKLLNSCSTVNGRSNIAASSRNPTSTSGRVKSKTKHQDVKEKKAEDKVKSNNLARKDQKAGDAVLGDKKTGDGNPTGKTVHLSKNHARPPKSGSTVPGGRKVVPTSQDLSNMDVYKRCRSVNRVTNAPESKKKLNEGKKRKGAGNEKSNTLVKKDQKTGDIAILGDEKVEVGNSKCKMVHGSKKHMNSQNTCSTTKVQRNKKAARVDPKDVLKSSKSASAVTTDSESKNQFQVSKKNKGASHTKDQKAGGRKQDKDIGERTSFPASKPKFLKNVKHKSRSPSSHKAKTSSQISSTKGPKNLGSLLPPLYPPSGRSVMVVESARKAEVIQSYLGDMFEVLPSNGHVRDISTKMNSVRPTENFSMIWEVPEAAWTHLKSIKVALNGAENLILASDPDCEGEAIAWHVMEMLQQQDALNNNVTVGRVVFHEITESSIKKALEMPREIDANLVNAYLARRALDYLIGFGLSPILWKKLPGCQSAGRVQSAALALMCGREMEIEEFKPQEYWSIGVDFHDNGLHSSVDRPSISSQMTHFSSREVDQFSISSSTEAEAIVEKVKSSKFQVQGLKKITVRKNPPMPYITSTLQEDSANKFQFSSAYTMKLAQKLYEGIKLSENEATGLITYMRTDGLHISDEVAADILSFAKYRYGEDFTSKCVRKYDKKVKNARVAHEAIRPTNIRRLPSSLIGILDDDSLKLYTLIWSRTIACQMEPMATEEIQVNIGSTGGDIIFRSVGSKVMFPGYLAAYQDREAGFDGSDENGSYDGVSAYDVLHKLQDKDGLSFNDVDIQPHHTVPPQRYSEGTLVKKMEELGIGRPSTYASMLKVLQDRNYITIKSQVLVPEFRGRMVSEFISHNFSEVADFSFMAKMEKKLDNVSAGTTRWKRVVRDFWERFSENCNLARKAEKRQVEEMVEKKFQHFLFDSLPNKRVCPRCCEGTLNFQTDMLSTKLNWILVCDVPRCKYTIHNDLPEDPEEDTKVTPDFEAQLLGIHPASGEQVLLKKGPYGHYVQIGEDMKGCQRAPVSEVKNIDSLSLEGALDLFDYPLELGKHPVDGKMIIVTNSGNGFMVKHRHVMCRVPKNVNPKEMTVRDARKLLKSENATRTGRIKKKKVRRSDVRSKRG